MLQVYSIVIHSFKRLSVCAVGCECSACPTVCNPWTAACQAPLSMEFSSQEYWCGWVFPTLEDLTDPGMEPAFLLSPALAGRFFTTKPLGKPPSPMVIIKCWLYCLIVYIYICIYIYIYTYIYTIYIHTIYIYCVYIYYRISPGQNTGVGCLSLLQEIFAIQGSNPGYQPKDIDWLGR